MESRLIKDCLKGNTTAQTEVYYLFAGQMLGVCYRYTKSLPDAEDLLQEGFIKVFSKLKQFNGQGPLGAWIRRIMVHTAINFLQKKRLEFTALNDSEWEEPISQDGSDLKLLEKEMADLIRKLPSGYQTIFNLHAVEGYSHSEIASLLNIQEGTSRSQYARARSQLMKWILQMQSSHPKLKQHVGK